MTKECITPLCRRMIEDMTVRHLASETQRNYIRAVKTFLAFSADRPTRPRPKTCVFSNCT